MSAKILVTGQTFTPDALKMLDEKGYDIEVRPEYLDEDALAGALRGKNAYIIGGVEYGSAKAMASAEDLRVVAVMGVGYQSFVDAEAATKRGIAVTNTPGANSRAVAEMTIGLMLAMKRKIAFINRLTKTGGWRDDIVTKNLHGEVLGIVGMGTIGTIVADIAGKGLGMEVVYVSRTAKPDVEDRTGAKRVSLAELLRVSDIVSLHCSLTPETTNLIGEQQFREMKPSAILVNVARPKVVNPSALYGALKSGTIAGCAMDGYYAEPAPAQDNDPHGLLGLSDEVFLVTSHLAYLTEDSISKMCELAAQSVINVLEGRDWIHIVNPEFREYRQ